MTLSIYITYTCLIYFADLCNDCQITDLPYHSMEDLWSNMAQDIQFKLMLLLPVDIEDCAYISLYSPDTRERIASSNVSNDQLYHNWYVVVFPTDALNYICMYMHNIAELFECYTTILSSKSHDYNNTTDALPCNHIRNDKSLIPIKINLKI